MGANEGGGQWGERKTSRDLLLNRLDILCHHVTNHKKRMALVHKCDGNTLTSSFLLYMPVFAALAGGKVALYHPLQAPAGSKVLNRPLEELQRAVK
jgi:hypothetical protein